MAAVLACGDGAVLSHLSAAHLWQLLDPRPGATDVSIRRAGGITRRRRIRVHCRRSLDPAAITKRQRIPVTTPARTIIDLRGVVSPAQHRHAIRQAEVSGLPTGRKSTERTRSELEHLFLRLCERHRIPMPEINVRVGPYEVDFLWRAERLIVETDGYRYHRGSQAFEDDHARDLELHTHGYVLRSFTHHQVTKHPERVAASVREALGR
jgi:very-short-patch-repair endonuclease